MPRKTKEQTEIEKEENKRKPTKKSTTSKAKTTKKSSSTRTTKSSTTAKASTKRASSTVKKSGTAKKATTAKSSTAKKTTAKKSTVKKTTTRKKVTKTDVKPESVEYYDLPYRYNQTIIKVLAQTPTTLFIYWDISDIDRKAFEEQYGDNFFETTKPVLIVRNETLGYSFEVEINDFANSWYLHINDSKCDYKVELGRRPITKTEKLNVDYIYVSSSNEIETPNDKILFNKSQKMVYFRDIKTGVQTSKEINNISFIRNMGKIYDIYDIHDIGKNDGINILSNPSSGSIYQ